MLLSGLAVMAWADEAAVTHVVRRGDTLSGISKKYYGDSRVWNRIVEANSLRDPDRLREGQRLVIPLAAAPVATHPTSASARDTARPAQPVQPSAPPTGALDSEAIRCRAAAAVVQQYTNLNLSAYDPGYLVRLESPTPDAGARVVVSWLGREALALEKGTTPEMDRKQVVKIEVWMTEEGRVLKVVDRPVWLGRTSQRIKGAD